MLAFLKALVRRFCRRDLIATSTGAACYGNFDGYLRSICSSTAGAKNLVQVRPKNCRQVQ